MLKGYGKFIATAMLGATLVGCSSTEKMDDYQHEPAEDVTPEPGKGIAFQGSNVDSIDLDGKKLVDQKIDYRKLSSQEIQALIKGKVVYFAYDSSNIDPDYYELIKLNAIYMDKNPNLQITVSGNCDERGSREYNLALGERRAIAVKNALVIEGVNPGRINIVSFGEDMPVDEAHNEAAWAKNRRAELTH